MQTLFINIKELLQVRDNHIDKISGSEMAILPKIDNAFLLINDNLIILKYRIFFIVFIF